MRKMIMPSIPPARPPMAPSIVFLGLTRGASLCLPKAIPANSAAESEQNAATSTISTIPPPCSISRSRIRQLKARGMATPAATIAHTSRNASARGVPYSTTTLTNSRTSHAASSHAISAAAPASPIPPRYVCRITVTPMMPLRPHQRRAISLLETADSSSWAPTAHRAHSSIAVAQSGAMINTNNSRGIPTTATKILCNIDAPCYDLTPPNRRSRP